MKRVIEKFLIIRVKNGDEKAFGKIFDAYSNDVFRFIFFKVKSKEDAEDLLNEVFFKVWKYIVEGENIVYLKAFIFKVARNLIIDYYRKNKRDKSINLTIEDIEKGIPDNIEDKVFYKIEIEKVMKVLNNLKQEYQDVILLRYVENMEIREISEVLNKSIGAIRVLLSRALKNLKKLLEENG